MGWDWPKQPPDRSSWCYSSLGLLVHGTTPRRVAVHCCGNVRSLYFNVGHLRSVLPMDSPWCPTYRATAGKPKANNYAFGGDGGCSRRSIEFGGMVRASCSFSRWEIARLVPPPAEHRCFHRHAKMEMGRDSSSDWQRSFWSPLQGCIQLMKSSLPLRRLLALIVSRSE